jgi:hypothetical protein
MPIKSFLQSKTYDAREGLTLYTKNLEAGAMMAKDLTKAARETGAPDVENFAAEICGTCSKELGYLVSIATPIVSITDL